MAFMAALAVATACAENLVVNVTTEGPREGSIDILVFNSEQGFPNKPTEAFRQIRFPITAEDPVVCTITNLPYGTYSLSVLHDINNNYKADKTLAIGPPKEPVGFSNISEKPRKRPSYEDTLFTFAPGQTKQTVILRYVF